MAYSSTSNASLPKPTYQNVIHDDMDLLKTAHDSAMDILDMVLTKAVNIATNATIVNTLGARLVKLYVTSLAGSISTITGATKNVPFTLMGAGSNASTANHLLYDVSPFALSADWNPGVAVGGNLTLIWDGTTFYEVGRVATV